MVPRVFREAWWSGAMGEVVSNENIYINAFSILPQRAWLGQGNGSSKAELCYHCRSQRSDHRRLPG